LTQYDSAITARLISICIPTYNRADLLGQALDSCFEQTYPEYEIVIGDDSKDDVSEQLVSKYDECHPGKIRYQRNTPSLGQNANVNDLFLRANGDRLVLLHDDDMLLPNALERLASCWDLLPTLAASFGKQYIVDHHANILSKDSEGLNKAYYRITANSGRQAVPAIPGLLRMFPNDGYMVATALARQTGYRSRDIVGDACDLDFGLRFCMAASNVWFLDEYTSKYRLSEDAVSKHAYPAAYAYDLLKEARVPPDAMNAQRIALEGIAPRAASCFARLDEPGRALGVFLSPHYTLRDKMRVRAFYHLFLIAASFVRKLPSNRESTSASVR
jgi:glycosyltransferase involved in cell wall biosynthesis